MIAIEPEEFYIIHVSMVWLSNRHECTNVGSASGGGSGSRSGSGSTVVVVVVVLVVVVVVVLW